MSANRSVRWGCALALTVLIAGCGKSTATSAGSAEPVFDPCALTTEQMTVIGDKLDLTDNGKIGSEVGDARSCTWTDDWYTLTVESHPQSFDQARSNTAFAQFTPITLPGRDDAARFTSRGDTFQESCGIVLSAGPGVAVVSVSNTDALTGEASPHNTCDKAVEIAEKLDRYFPR